MVYASRFLRWENILMQGPDVLALQKRLQELGYDPGVADSVFGEKCAHAVKCFQKANAIHADGVVGPDTWNRLDISPVMQPLINICYEHNYQPSIAIDVDNKILSFLTDKSCKTYPVAVGKPSTPTPLGNWLITQKALNPGGPFGARWMRLSIPWGGYGIHGTNNPSSIGTAASHGCVRMYNADVIELYDLTPIGTAVTIFGTADTGRLLKKGCRGTDVKELQEKLKVLGYYQASIDGYFGAKTEKALIAFQKDQQLCPDGIMGPITAQALQKALDIQSGDQLP